MALAQVSYGQITDQNTPYCDELGYPVSNDIKMLAVIQRRDGK